MHKKILFLSGMLLLLASSACKKEIVLPEGVQVLVNGQSIAGNTEVLVGAGEPVQLDVSGLQPNSNLNLKIRKLGINLHEEDFTVNASGTVNQSVPLPDIEAQATAVIAYTDWSGTAQQISFVIKIRST
ncbi:MAG: hypothetical protein AAGN35_25230 [Bacteroidota bacterium]